MKTTILLPAFLLLAGCAGTLHDHLDLSDGTTIRSGMTAESLRQTLGAPDSESFGVRDSRFAQRFWLQTFRMAGRTEWAWVDRDPLVVAWLERNRVVGLGTVARNRAYPPPRSGESVRKSIERGTEPLVTDWFRRGEFLNGPYKRKRKGRHR